MNTILATLQTILTSTISIYRFELRGTIELMVGGKVGSTPWHLTIGNPYSPWFATNHIIIKTATVTTSNEMGFNDQPQRLTATFEAQFSRALGKQELMRMFNNSYRRTYASPPKGSTTGSLEIYNNKQMKSDQADKDRESEATFDPLSKNSLGYGGYLTKVQDSNASQAGKNPS